MIMPLESLIEKFNLKIRGIIHVGASQGQEAASYFKCGIKDVVWIEAIPDLYKLLSNYLAENYPQWSAFQACIADEDDKAVKFNITSNQGQSSSFLPLKDHKILYPNIVVLKQVEMKTITLDSLISDEKLETGEVYNFLAMDIQGAELLALRGARNNLAKFDYIYLEVNERELYEGCALVHEVDDFLATFGFKGVISEMRPKGWGDKLYIREKLMVDAPKGLKK